MLQRYHFSIILFPFVLYLFFFSSSTLFAQTRFSENTFSPVIDSLFKTNATFFGPYQTQKDFYRLQIIYTQIDRDANNIPSFTHHTWRLKPDEYFNPASFVKLPAAVFALEKMNEVYAHLGIDKYTRLSYEKNTECEDELFYDSTCVCLYPNIAHFIKRALLVSENGPFKRLYEFLGQEYLNQELTTHGLAGSRIIQRFASTCDEEGNRYTNAINFYDDAGRIIYHQPEQYNAQYVHAKDSSVMVGQYIMDGRKKIKGGKDFSNANRLMLHHIHQLMLAIFFPEQMPKELRLNLTRDDFMFLRKYLGMRPDESKDPVYDTKKFYSTYDNYFLYGQSKYAEVLKDVRIFNKVAMAFGFLSETAYVVDFKNKREFLVSATIYVNKDGVLLDNTYDYLDVGLPFFKNFGYVLYQHELNRKVAYAPNLSVLQSLFLK